MKRLLLIAFAACAFALAPTLSASAMPGATPKALTDTDSSIVLVKGGHGHGGGHGWGRGHSHRAFGWSQGRKVGWRGRGCPPGQWKKYRC
jgi:hypothetical protein